MGFFDGALQINAEDVLRLAAATCTHARASFWAQSYNEIAAAEAREIDLPAAMPDLDR